MGVVMHNAAFYCDPCAAKLGIPDEPEFGGPYDSDEYGISYPDAGESDSPVHCDECHELLDCSLTDEGRDYVRAAIENFDDKGWGDERVIEEWRSAFYID